MISCSNSNWQNWINDFNGPANNQRAVFDTSGRKIEVAHDLNRPADNQKAVIDTSGREIEVAPSLRCSKLYPEWLARYNSSSEWLSSAGVQHMWHDATKLGDLDREFNDPMGLLAAINNPASPDSFDVRDKGSLIFKIREAWEQLKIFCSNNPKQGESLTNLRNAFDAIRDCLTSTDPSLNPLIKGADSLASLVTKMAAAGLTDQNRNPIKAPKWD